MAHVEVTGPSPYTIHIAHRITDQVAPRAKEIGARKVCLLYTSPSPRD